MNSVIKSNLMLISNCCMEKILKDYQVYLFDMDGTLVNSEPLKGKALALACKDHDANIDFNIYKDVMGESWEVVTGYFFKTGGISPDSSEFNSSFKAHYEHLLLENLELNKGAKEYIEELKLIGKTCGLVSSAASWMVNNILEILNLDRTFDIVITQEDVTRHKPDPEAYNLALERLGMSPERVVIFEDSTAGISAGLASGCNVIAINHEFNSNNDLSGALRIIKSFEDLLF